MFGSPIMIDTSMEDLKRPNCARIAVEIDMRNLLPHQIWIGEVNDGFWQPLITRQIPFLCSNCQKIGHTAITYTPGKKDLKSEKTNEDRAVSLRLETKAKGTIGDRDESNEIDRNTSYLKAAADLEEVPDGKAIVLVDANNVGKDSSEEGGKTLATESSKELLRIQKLDLRPAVPSSIYRSLLCPRLGRDWTTIRNKKLAEMASNQTMIMHSQLKINVEVQFEEKKRAKPRRYNLIYQPSEDVYKKREILSARRKKKQKEDRAELFNWFNWYSDTIVDLICHLLPLSSTRY